ncbi:MAG: hypothetical protein M3680_33510 [Myxococcota bacterium]|nr:hypothetical protein [Myxococcota bacterium]
MKPILATLLLLAACKGKRADAPPPSPSPPAPAAAAASDARATPDPWAPLAGYPQVTPVRVIEIPARPDVPRFAVGGPVIAGDLAIVASSQFGFAAIDYRRGTLAWTKPAGHHVAPPLVKGTSIVLVADCLTPPAIAAGETLLGCLRVVTTTGADESYVAIRGAPDAVAEFASATGPHALYDHGERTIRWRRGDHAVSVDIVSGLARPAPAAPPPLVVGYRGTQWQITQDEGRIVAHSRGKLAWQTEHPYSALIGSVWLPELSPLLRLVNLGAFGDTPEVHLIDMDATGSLRAAVGRPTPGIGLLGWGASPQGDAAIAVRMDTSLAHDFVVGYAANAMLMWIFRLPEVPRADPVGVAVAPDAVVVFHDGDTLSILPELSAPPTAPGATAGSSQNPTP